jgi:hypothetical protein
LGCEELSRKTSLVDISALKNISILQGCRLYCLKDCLTNTYIQNVIKLDVLPSYDRTNICFHLLNREEESSKVSSVVSVSKSDYVEKMLSSLSLLKKKKKRSKRREETVSSPKHVATIIDYDDSELDDVLTHVTYVSDHDWEKHSTFDIENLFGTNSENVDVNNCCTISAIHVPSYDDMFDEYALEDSYSIAYHDYNDKNNIFSSPTIEEETRYDYNMPPILIIMVMRIVILVNLLLLRVFMWGVLILLYIWLMIGMFYVIVILLILFMMLLKVTIREGNMVRWISIILSFPSLCCKS